MNDVIDSGNVNSPVKEMGDKVKPLSRGGVEQKKTVKLKSSNGLFRCFIHITKYVFVGIFSLIVRKTGINWFLQSFGLSLEPLNLSSQGEKRKYSEVDDKDAADDEKNTTEHLKMEVKRWRPDHVYEAINEFVKKMWGEKDTNKNITEDEMTNDENEENMNNFASVHDVKWNKKPDINFVSKKALGISISEGEGLIRDLTPKKSILKENYSESNVNVIVHKCEEADASELEGFEVVHSDGLVKKKFLLDQVEETIETSTPLVENKTPEVFVFSADKSTNSNKSVEDLQNDEQSMLSLMTFGEKRIYFAQKIKDHEAAALKSAPRSPKPAV